MKTIKQPERFLVGVGSVLAGAGLLFGCHGSSGSAMPVPAHEAASRIVTVQRTRYASVLDCQQNWNADDCRSMRGMYRG
ncbi:MAG: hypothetical protein ACRYGL_16890 [Janthinobacterium lividum]